MTGLSTTVNSIFFSFGVLTYFFFLPGLTFLNIFSYLLGEMVLQNHP